MPIHVALVLSLAESVALSGLLFAWADRVAGARLLVLFLLGVAAWIVGNELPVWTGPVAERPALILLGTAALTSAAFLHFALAFRGLIPPRGALGLAYAVALGATLAGAGPRRAVTSSTGPASAPSRCPTPSAGR